VYHQEQLEIPIHDGALAFATAGFYSNKGGVYAVITTGTRSSRMVLAAWQGCVSIFPDSLEMFPRMLVLKWAIWCS